MARTWLRTGFVIHRQVYRVQCVVVLVMLDLSSAFDTINHDTLMDRLQHSVGITDSALSWRHSYITERYQRVAVDSATSAECVMKCDVPQGSVLGPILYCIYTRPIGDIVAWHGLQYHYYADDTHTHARARARTHTHAHTWQ